VSRRRLICIIAVVALVALTGTARPASERGALVATVLPRHGVALRERPNGPVVAVVGDRTEFGSPRTFAIFARRGANWVGVAAPELPNGQLGWINARSSSVRLVQAPIWIEVDLSRRELTVHRQNSVPRRFRVAIGAPESPTPVGRFAVTDKLPGADFGSTYGCCILALSGHQTRLPPGWTGGDRLAIHATSDPEDIGARVSAGCVRALDADLLYLMRVIPLGTPVFIHS
jgi:lipoprotein-anchoring transpeptidase ErfK/SrfK